tara:strand:- start:9912 stop:11297 length:1386 start_codon:yes stop_codon:yes gene_type:complete
MNNRSDVVPENIDQLVNNYYTYILGGVRRQGTPVDLIGDRASDIVLHCASSNFFERVKEKIDSGEMTPSRFRSYLSTTISNCLRNIHTRSLQDVSYRAIPLANPSNSDEDSPGVNLERLLVDENEEEIPFSVLSRGFVIYVAERKPEYVPTLLLLMEGHTNTEISVILGKHRENVHYRLRALRELLTSFLSRPDDVGNTGGRTHEWRYVVCSTAAFPPAGSDEETTAIWAKVKSSRAVVTLSTLTQLLQEHTGSEDMTAEASALLVAAVKAGALVSEARNHGRKKPMKVEYLIPPQASNPYRKWSAGQLIFSRLPVGESISLERVDQAIRGLLDGGKLQSSRSVADIRNGFIRTARGYGVLVEYDEHTKASSPPSSQAPSPTRNTEPLYRLRGKNPYVRGMSYQIWEALKGLDFTPTDVQLVAEKIIAKGEYKTARTAERSFRSFWSRVAAKGSIHIECVG